MAPTVDLSPPDVAAGVSLTVAGVRLTADALASDLLPASFQAFLRANAPADLACRLACRGPDPALDALAAAPEHPWSFRVQASHCEVIRRNRAGNALWRIRAPLSYTRAEIAWSPGRFLSHYRSYELCWARILGMFSLAMRLRACHGLVFHGMAAEVNGQGVLCVGPSGRGKSTLARLLDGAGFRVLSDERPVVRMRPGTVPGGAAFFQVHGSPWYSAGGFAVPAAAPLRRLLFLEHGAENRVAPLLPRDALRRLLHVMLVPWQNPLLFDPCLDTIEALLGAVPAAVFSFRPDAAAADVVRCDLDTASTGARACDGRG